jgi:hypothetical protein
MWPFTVWGLDLVRPLQKAPGGFTHLLFAVDKFSKWIEAWPIAQIKSEQAVLFFTDIIHRFRVPNCIITDNSTYHHQQWYPVHRQEIPSLLR